MLQQELQVRNAKERNKLVQVCHGVAQPTLDETNESRSNTLTKSGRAKSFPCAPGWCTTDSPAGPSTPQAASFDNARAQGETTGLQVCCVSPMGSGDELVLACPSPETCPVCFPNTTFLFPTLNLLCSHVAPRSVPPASVLLRSESPAQKRDRPRKVVASTARDARPNTHSSSVRETSSP